MSDLLDKKLKDYLGDDYASPKKICTEELNLLDEEITTIDDLLSLLNNFVDKHKNEEVLCNFERGYYDESSYACINSYRLELPEETQERIEKYKKSMAQRDHQKLEQYRKLKQEFESIPAETTEEGL